MGCDIHSEAQRRENGRWVRITGSFHDGSAPFNWRSYGMYGFLAGVRNYSGIAPICEPRRLPKDYEGSEDGGGPASDDCHSHSWLTVAELAVYDYNQMIEDRRTTVQTGPKSWNGAHTCEPGEGRRETLREFLGDAFFDDLAELQRIGAERIVFSFDN